MKAPADSLAVDTTAAVTPQAHVAVQKTDTIQYLGVLPDVFPEPKVVCDTLPKLNLQPFVPKDTLKLTRYHSMREFAPGEEGKPLKQDVCSSDVMMSIILACTLIVLFVLSHTHKYINQRLKDYFVVHGPSRKFLVDTVGDARSMGVLILQSLVFAAILFFSYFVHTDRELLLHVQPYYLLAIYVGMCLLYFCLKWAVYSFLGWIFFSRQTTSIFVSSYSTLVSLMGFLGFPLILWIIFAYISPANLLTAGIYLLILAKILIIYKWLKLFSPKFVQIFLLILYFCALEIIPCFLFWQSMVQMNTMLIKNF
jgi:hypothetical protein